MAEASAKHQGETTVDYYAGIDVSLECSSVCVVDGQGKIEREAKVASEPDALIAWFAALEVPLARIGLEAGPLSQWLFAALQACGLAVELLETRHVRDAFKAMPVKTDRKDAPGIAQLMRLGWFRPVHCKSLPAQEVRALLTTRKLLQSKRHDVEMSIRGVLRGFGLKVGPTTPKTFEQRVRELVAHHDTLEQISEALLKARAVLLGEFKTIERRLVGLARRDAQVRNLTSVPGVGALVALTFSSAIDDPARFRSSRMVGAHFGLTPKKYQSGETDVTGRISKIGDHGVRGALYEAANVMLTRPVKSSALKSWALAVAKRAGMRKAKVALARKLAVVLHRMMRSGEQFLRAGRAATVAC
ncbi:transposase [Mesorhizobium shonense]|uniref:Transposase n=1 Tax=Mesorhizobium shonense TaxID=1209948 RepID=A0ABV2I530_9HYPH